MPEIVNHQRKFKVNLTAWQDFANKAVKSVTEAKNKNFTVAFVSDRKMRGLNKIFRGKNRTTDVLSFPFAADKFEEDENNLGDVVISLEQAAKQSKENNLDFETEIKQLILHGVLHLCGYDHENDKGEMNARELEVRDKLGI